MTDRVRAYLDGRLAELYELAGFNEWGAVDAFPPVYDALDAVLALVNEAEASNGLRSEAAQQAWRAMSNFSADEMRRAVAAHLDRKENPNG